MLEMVGLAHKMDMKPLDLSAGEQQRIAIARALVNQPAIVLADEPTGNLDSVNSTMILELFQDLNQRLGQTIMMITHNPEAAAVAHRTIEMKDGRVLSHGILPQLVDRSGDMRLLPASRLLLWDYGRGSLPYDVLCVLLLLFLLSRAPGRGWAIPW